MRVPLVVACVAFLALPNTSFADAATHRFDIVSANSMPSDCAGGRCSTACMITARLTPLRPDIREIVIVNLRFKVRGGAQTLQFNFQPASAGLIETGDHVEGVACSNLPAPAISVDCDAPDDRCPSFTNVAITAYGGLRLKAQKVQAP